LLLRDFGHHEIILMNVCVWSSHGGEFDLWNVGKLLPDYTALQPRR
jgi:hypothetical protein